MDEAPFDFWDRHRLWETLARLLKARMARQEGWYVSPSEAVRKVYTGPKMGWRKVGEEWRLGYFYPGAWTEPEPADVEVTGRQPQGTAGPRGAGEGLQGPKGKP